MRCSFRRGASLVEGNGLNHRTETGVIDAFEKPILAPWAAGSRRGGPPSIPGVTTTGPILLG
jgi:hypothetical protein